MATVKSNTIVHKAGNDFQLTTNQNEETMNCSTPVQNGCVVVNEEDKPSADMVYVVPGDFTENGNHVAPTGKAFNPVNVNVSGGGGSQTATPKFSPAAGGVPKGTEVTISCDTAGATIYYTTDGSTPTLDSPEYDGSPIPVNAEITIKAIALKVGLSTSAVGSATYTVVVPKVANPVFTPSAGEVLSGTEVTLSCATTGAEIHYTTDGSNPTSESPVYSEVFTITEQITIKAIAIKEDYDDSAVVTAQYKIGQPTAAAPTFSPAAGEVVSGTKVSLATTTPGGVIHYTTNGSTPTASSPVYSEPINIPAQTTVKAITVADGYKNSSVASATYRIKPVTLNYFAGWYISDQMDISSKEWTQEDLENLSGLDTGVASSANSPTNPYIYTCTAAVDDGGRMVWAYPASFGKVNYFTDGLGKHAITDSYTNRQCTVNGVEYEIYYLTTPLSDDEGAQYPQTFTQN